MSNLSFEEKLIRDHPKPEPLEGYSVVLFERVGESGETFRRVLDPGVPLPKERNPFKRMFDSTEYVAVAVSAAPELRLEFRERMVSAEHMHELDLVFNLYYAVAEPRVVASLRADDPLRQVRDRVAQLVSYEMARQPWETVLENFASTAEEVVLGVLGELRAFARDFGIALRSVRVSSRLEQADADAAVAYRRERDRKRRELAEEELDTAVQLKGIRARVLESKGDAAVQVIGTLAGNVQTVQEAVEFGNGLSLPNGAAPGRLGPSGDVIGGGAVQTRALTSGAGALESMLVDVMSATQKEKVRNQDQRKMLRAALLRLVADVLVEEVDESARTDKHAEGARAAIARLDPRPSAGDLQTLHDLADPDRLRDRLSD